MSMCLPPGCLVSELASRRRPFPLLLICRAFAIAWMVWCASLHSVTGQEGPAIAPRLRPAYDKLAGELESQVRPWIEEHCLDCHDTKSAEAGLDLSKKFKLDHVVASPEKWRGLLRRVEAGEMPPPDHAVLTAAERLPLESWLRSALFDLACEANSPARSPALRRLTRFEYEQSVFELTGVRFQTSSNFPADEVGHGFDNIAGLLNVSPLLTEKYLAAAETIAQQAIIDPAIFDVDQSWNGAELDGDDGTRSIEQDQVLSTRGALRTNVSIPSDGKFTVTVEAYGQQAGEGWIVMGLVVDGIQVATDDVKSRQRSPSKHKFEIDLKKGQHRLAVSFNNDFYDPKNPDPSKRDRNLIVCEVKIKGPNGGGNSPLGPRQKEIVFVQPTSKAKSADAAKQVLGKLGRQAFRQPVSAEDLARFVKLFEQQTALEASYEGALQTCLTAILVSPRFLFKIEQVPGKWESRRLDDHELASALAFFLWSGPPDSKLDSLADSGSLRDRAILDKEITRMLGDRRISGWLDNFVEQWLHLRLLDQFDPDPKAFPESDPALVQSMKRETKLFVAELVKSNLPIIELTRGDFTFVDHRLEKLYGLTGSQGIEFQRVELTDLTRRGVLTQASILALTSNPNRTSPVKRGKWILENLIGQPPPPPLPDVAQLDNQSRLTGTMRQKLEQHRADPNCASCHLKMDALGFALEGFDAIGRARELEDGQPIDDRGELPGGIEVDGAKQLSEVLSNSYERQIARCFVEKLLTFAIGRGLALHDDRAVDKILESTRADDFRTADLIRSTIHSDSFQLRSGGPD